MYRIKAVTILALLGAAYCDTDAVNAATIQVATGTSSWSTPANWNPAVPNAVGDNATFNSAASGSNPVQTGNRTITLDGTKTVGSITFNNDATAFTNTVSTGTGGPLVFDETSSGPATIGVPVGVGTGNNTISVAMTLNDTVVATVDNITASSAAGALNLTAAMSGAGGFTKNGDGLATFGTGAKTYTGATVLNGGRLRASLAAYPTATSGFTINTGGQLEPISAGTYTFGPNALNLNGNGPTSGPFAAFAGAIRPTSATAITIANPVVLQSTSTVHSQGAGTGSITFSGAISGGGGLVAGASAHDAAIGQINLSGLTNSYTGGTTVNAGALVAGAATTNAFGTGNVTVVSAHAVFAGSSASLSILAGAVDAINNGATLSLAGGNLAGVADDGYANLGTGIIEVVGALFLGGVQQFTPGTYGSTSSGATFTNNEYFTGNGVVSLVVPEPASVLLLGLATMGLVVTTRRNRAW